MLQLGRKSIVRLASPSHPEHRWALRLAWPVGALILFILVAAAGYRVIDSRYTWLDALYMTVISIATVGYREVHSLSAQGRAWTMFVILGGLVTGAVVMSMLVAMIVEGQVRTILGRRQLESKIASLSKHVIVCGYGRMGHLVAAELAAAKQSIVVVESDPERTRAAGALGLLYVLGDAQQEEALQAAGIARAAVLVTALPQDAQNVFVTLSARKMNPELRIIARAIDMSAQDILMKAGATRVVCAHILGALKMAAVVLRPAVVDFVDGAREGVEIAMDQFELSADSKFVGRSLEQLAMPKRAGVQICAVKRSGGKTVYQPEPEFVLAAGDVLVMVSRGGGAAAVEELEAKLHRLVPPTDSRQ